MENIKNNAIEIAIAFSLYWVFVAPLYLLPELKSGQITYYLFLPAGIKLFSILIFQWRGLIGATLGTFSRLTFTDPNQPIVSWLIVAVAATLAIYIVVELGLRFMKIKDDLSNLHYYQVVLLAVVASVINGSVFAYAVSALTVGQYSEGLFHSGFVTVMGNFAGNAFIACLLLFIAQHKEAIQRFVNSKNNIESKK